MGIPKPTTNNQQPTTALEERNKRSVPTTNNQPTIAPASRIPGAAEPTTLKSSAKTCLQESLKPTTNNQQLTTALEERYKRSVPTTNNQPVLRSSATAEGGQPTTPGPKRVLVTGGAGFIGSHLCDKLIAQGHEVLCLDNFYTGRRANILHLLDNPAFELIRHDVIEPLRLEIDEIYNLACPASPVHYQHNPVATTKTSIVGALNMLGLAKRLKIKILQASTSEVYGDPAVHPQPETYWGNVNPIGPRSCYDEGKRCAETLFFDYYRQHKLKIKVARIFNTYGPRMNSNDGRVVSNFIVQALCGDDITVYGDGSQTRSFCYVDDMVKGLISLMKSPDDFTGPVNIGNPDEFTVLQLAKKIIEITGSKSHIIHKPLPQDDPRQRKPIIDLAKEQLEWQPTIPLEEGLKKTVEYFSRQFAVDR